MCCAAFKSVTEYMQLNICSKRTNDRQCLPTLLLPPSSVPHAARWPLSVRVPSLGWGDVSVDDRVTESAENACHGRLHGKAVYCAIRSFYVHDQRLDDRRPTHGVLNTIYIYMYTTTTCHQIFHKGSEESGG